MGADFQGRYGLEATDTTVAYNLAGAITSTQTSLSIESAHRNGLGVFGQADAQVTRRIHLSGGLRGDTVHNTNIGGYFGDRHVVNTALAGLAGATFIVSPHLTLTAQVGPRVSRSHVVRPLLSRSGGARFHRGQPRSPTRDQPANRSDRPMGDRPAPVVRRVLRLPHFESRRALRRQLDQLLLPQSRRRAPARRGDRSAGRACPWHRPGRVGAGLARAVMPTMARRSTTSRRARWLSSSGTRLAGRLASYLRAAAVAPHDAAGPSEVPHAGLREPRRGRDVALVVSRGGARHRAQSARSAACTPAPARAGSTHQAGMDRSRSPCCSDDRLSSSRGPCNIAKTPAKPVSDDCCTRHRRCDRRARFGRGVAPGTRASDPSTAPGAPPAPPSALPGGAATSAATRCRRRHRSGGR